MTAEKERYAKELALYKATLPVVEESSSVGGAAVAQAPKAKKAKEGEEGERPERAQESFQCLDSLPQCPPGRVPRKAPRHENAGADQAD